MRRSLLLVALVAAGARGLAAQGALNVQGYGYPTGQLSSGALAVGGATGEIDPASPINPAAIGLQGRYSIYLQFEPEFRRTTVGGSDATSSTMRFPGFTATGSIGRFTAGASFSTLLDRTWTNVYSDSQLVGGELLPSTLTAASNGAMTDARFAVSYWASSKLQLGVALHGITGENRVTFGRSFPDSTGLGAVQQSSTINFSGGGISAGAVLTPVKGLLIGASARFGGKLSARQEGTSIGQGEMPSRFGVGVSYFGIPNTTLSARIDRTNWTSMRDIGTAQMSVFDATEIGLGVDVAGPRIGGALSTARLGFRDRTLPFGINGEQVSEHAFSGGIAVPLARGRAQIDLSLQRAVREAAGAQERSWFLSFGLGIRP